MRPWRATIILVIAGLGVVAAAWVSPPVRGFRRRLAAQRLYKDAFAAYMLGRVDRCQARLRQIAGRYGDLPEGALAELRIAFLAYDEQADLDRAETLFREFLSRHPEGVMYLSQMPVPDYEGELELVAYYFLGRIAGDRGDNAQARAWFERIIEHGSRNPGNIIVGETKTLVRMMDQEARKPG